MKTLGMFLGSLLIAAVIAIGAAFVVTGLTCDTAHAQETISLLNDDEHTLPLRFLRHGFGSDGLGAELPIRGTQQYITENQIKTKISNPYVIDWSDPELTYRNLEIMVLETIPDPITGSYTSLSCILEILPDGSSVGIGRVETLYERDADGRYIPVSSTIMYVDSQGCNVVLHMSGMPDWKALMAAMATDEGIFYGVPGGGLIMKARNEFDSKGNRVFSILKTWKFDEAGTLIGTETIREKLYYDNKNNLVYSIKTKEADGKILEVASTSRAYRNDGTLYMSVTNHIKYGSDGSVIGSMYESALYDESGREISYSSTEEKNNPEWNVRGWEMINIKREARYDSAGRLVYKKEYRQEQTIPRWGPLVNQVVIAYEGETVNEYEYDAEGSLIRDHETGYWFTTYIDPYFDRLTTIAYGILNGVKEITHMHISKTESTDSNFTNIIYRYEYDTKMKYAGTNGEIGIRTTSVEEKFDNEQWGGFSYQKIETDDSALYDADGKVLSTHHFYKEQVIPKFGPFTGVLTTTKEEETTVDYIYDNEGDLVNKHEYGYWFVTNIDPFFDRVTSFLYDIINGVKKILHISESFTESYDASYSRVFHQHNRDEIYAYTVINGNVLLSSQVTNISDFQGSGDAGTIGTLTITVRNESYSYSNAGLLLSKSDLLYTNGNFTSLELTTYGYYADGTLASTARHLEKNDGYWENETVLYNEKGCVIYKTIEANNGRSYIERCTYAENGTTLLTRDISEYNPYVREEWGDVILHDDSISIDMPVDSQLVKASSIIIEPYYGFLTNRDLHEEYRKDGKIINKTEKRVYKQRCFWGPIYIDLESDFTMNNNVIMPWWGSTTTTTIESQENWSYEGGTMSRYEKTEKMTTQQNFWGMTYFNECTTKVVQEYNPITGDLLKEEYTVTGSSEQGIIWYSVLDGMKKRDIYLPVNQSGDALMDNIGSFFFDSLGILGAAERKMVIDYSQPGKVLVSCVAKDFNGDTITAFFLTINYDAAGNILNLTVSYTGQFQEIWKDMIEGIDLTKIPLIHEPIVDPDPNDPPAGDGAEWLAKQNALDQAKKQSGGVFQRKALMDEPQENGLKLRWKK